MPNSQLILTDLDGTLFRDSYPKEATVEALSRFFFRRYASRKQKWTGNVSGPSTPNLMK